MSLFAPCEQEALCRYAVNLLSKLSGERLRELPRTISSLTEGLVAICAVKHNRPLAIVRCLQATLEKMQRSPEELTPVHAYFLQVKEREREMWVGFANVYPTEQEEDN